MATFGGACPPLFAPMTRISLFKKVHPVAWITLYIYNIYNLTSKLAPGEMTIVERAYGGT